MFKFGLGFFSASLAIEVATYYGWASKHWNDWTSIGIAIAAVCLFGAVVFHETFDITRRRR